MLSLPESHLITGIAVGEANLTEYRVLKTKVGLVFRAGLEDAILDTRERFESFPCSLELRTQRTWDGLVENIAQRH